MSWFVSGTSTGVGKTFVSRGLTAALKEQNHSVRALKPIETGCAPTAEDAIALADVCGQPELATAPGFYRAKAALSPLAAEMRGEPGCRLDEVVAQTHDLMKDCVTVVEGAGGLLVPVTQTETMCDLVSALGLPLILVAEDGLGVQSHVLSATTVCQQRDLQLACVVLNQIHKADSQRENLSILRERLFVPIISFGRCDDTTEALAKEAVQSGLVETLLKSA